MLCEWYALWLAAVMYQLSGSTSISRDMVRGMHLRFVCYDNMNEIKLQLMWVI